MRPDRSVSGVDIQPQLSGHSTRPSVSLPDLRILHFNDVYNVAGAAKEPVGGIARFQSRVNHYRNGEDFQGQPKLLTLFSGDGYNPSLESIFTKGTVALLIDVVGLLRWQSQLLTSNRAAHCGGPKQNWGRFRMCWSEFCFSLEYAGIWAY